MENVNGREDGNSGIEEEEEEKGNIILEAMVVPIGHSPPHSPSATHSPLMFTPQVPVVPLQRPDERHTSSQLWLQTTIRYKDGCTEKRVPTMITWGYGGKGVVVEGSWNNWKSRTPLQRCGKYFTIMKVLPSDVYQYKFIVDGKWRYASGLPWAQLSRQCGQC